MLPNFLIIGAMRCATGWISQCLREHPEIYVARARVGAGTRFFSRHYKKGLDWWEQTFYSGYKGEKAVGEKSEDYMSDPKVPQRIATSLPQAKLICCLRDPIERMYSHYIMLRTRKRDRIAPGTTFLQAATPDSDLVQRSLYFKQIKRFLEVFPQENLLIKIYEDKDIDPVGFIQDIYEFLDVDSTFVPPSANLQTKMGALERQNKLWSIVSRVLISRKSPFLFKVVYSKIRPKWNILDDVDQYSLNKLAWLFDTDIAELEKFMSRNLRCWKTKVLIERKISTHL